MHISNFRTETSLTRDSHTNLSSKILNQTEEMFFLKRLNFAVTHRNVPKLDMIITIEDCTNKLPLELTTKYKIRNKLLAEKNSKLNLI